jgi:hypothetical protein
MPQITVLDTSALPKAIIDAFDDMVWTRPYYTFGTFTLKVPAASTGAAELIKGRTILPPDTNIVYLIEQIIREDDGSGNDIITASGRDLGGMFSDRVCLPTAGLAYDTQSAVTAEAAMKHYVTNNAGSGAIANRQLPTFSVAASTGHGLTVTYQARYDYLSDVLAAIGQPSGIGWQVTWTGSGYIFDVIPGVDRHASVFFDTTFDTAQAQTWLSSDANTKDFTYVAGQGEGVARTIVQRFTGGAEPTGLARRELFTDARDLSDTNALNLRGDADLAQASVADSYEVTIQPNGSFKYRVDWDLGDLVTVRNRSWGLSNTSRVIGVSLHISEGMTSPEVVATLGRPFPTAQAAGVSGGVGSGSPIGTDTAAAGTYLPLAGGTVTGLLTANADFATPNMVASRAYKQVAQSIPSSTFTQITYPLVSFNTGSAYDSSSSTFTAPTAGWYEVNASFSIDAPGAADRIAFYVHTTALGFRTIMGNLQVPNDIAAFYGSSLQKLAAGDAVHIYCLGSVAFNIGAQTDDWHNTFVVRKVG